LLAQAGLEVTERNLVKQPLTVAELKALAKRAGGPEQLVAPKRRADAEDLDGDALYAWLAADGGNLRRPIIDVDGALFVGFSKETRAALEQKLR
jgi:arsenate reductase-like glutaredoxin family protein